MSKRFMDNAFWILKSIYYMYEPEKITKWIKKRMSNQELAEVTVFLENKGLINIHKRESGAPYDIALTDKGEEYVSDRLSKIRQEGFNNSVAFTGVILAAIGIYTFVLQNISFESHPNILLTIKTIFVVTLVLCIGPLLKIVFDFWKKEY